MVAAIHTSQPQCRLLQDLLTRLCNLGNRTNHLTRMTYEWCSVVCENYSHAVEGKELLLLSLIIGFRHLDPKDHWVEVKLTHTNHHKQMANIVFENGDDEAVADLLHVWTSYSRSHGPPTWLSICARHLISLQPSSLRLRQLVIRTIMSIGYQGFEQVGVEGFVGLLDHLQISIEDIDHKGDWVKLLLDAAQSSEGAQNLPHKYWETLVELAVSYPWLLEGGNNYSPHTMVSLEDAEEWEKLECWMGIVWMVWPPGCGKTTKEDLQHITLLLVHQRPGVIQKLGQWMERWSKRSSKDIPEAFQQIYQGVYSAEQEVL